MARRRVEEEVVDAGERVALGGDVLTETLSADEISGEIACEGSGEVEAVHAYCPVQATMELLQQKWTLLILRYLSQRTMRFNELALAVGGCNSRTLRDRLKTLETEDIVKRDMIAVMPPWVEYSLTPKGQALGVAMGPLMEWSQRWMVRTS